MNRKAKSLPIRLGPLPDMGRLQLLIAILTILAVTVGGIAIGVLYNTAFEVKRQDLLQLVNIQSNLISTVARFDADHSAGGYSDDTDHPEDDAGAVVSRIMDAFTDSHGFGKTGEFLLGRQEGNSVVLLRPHQHHSFSELVTHVHADDEQFSLAEFPDRGEAMRRALEGKTGTIVGPSHRGEAVLAAYDWIPELNLGIVAQVQMTEIRKPLVISIILVIAVGSAAILGGAYLFYSVSNPVFQSLTDNERRHRQMLETVFDGIITIDFKGKIWNVNPAAERAFGYSSDEMISQNVSMLMPEPFRSEHDGYLEAYRRTGNSTIIGIGRDVEAQRKDGSIFPMSLAICEMVIDGQTQFIGAVRDITDRKLAEDKANEKSKLIQLLLKIATRANEAATLDDALSKCLEAVCQFKEWPVGHAFILSSNGKQALESSKVWYLDKPEETRAFKTITDEMQFEAGIGIPGRVLSGGEALWVSTATADDNFPRRSFASEFGIRSGLGVPVKRNNEIVAVLEFFSFDDEKPDEAFMETLTHVANELGRVIERVGREQELRQSIHDKEKANRAKSEFLSSMSHELRTPLNAVLGFAQLLEYNPKSPLNEDQKGAVEHIKKGGHHLLELITQVLDLSKIETGNLTLSNEPIDVLDAIRSSVPTARQLADSRGITVTNNADGKSLPYIFADTTRLRQVLLNLLSNAVKYNRENGTIIVDADETASGMVRISVEDSGAGIAPDMQSKVFEAFNRLGRETMEIEGTGIGLTISKELVELMQGHIGFETEVDKGSTFWIELPTTELTVDDPVVQSDQEADAMITGEPELDRKVLYIEDNPTNVELMKNIFAHVRGTTLLVTQTGEEGIEIALSEKPDLILVDIQLPGIDGIETTITLRRHDETRLIPVIAISAAAMKSDVKRAEIAGFRAYITKPIDIAKTLQLVNEVLEG